jgi:hypothetical protein
MRCWRARRSAVIAMLTRHTSFSDAYRAIAVDLDQIAL